MNNKYELLKESLKAIKDGIIQLLILKGEAGFGKTYNATTFAEDNKLNYVYINTYVTPLAFYKLLYQNRGRELIIFDDLQSIHDPKIKAMFKAACWKSDKGKRTINYHSTSKILQSEEIPESFEFDSKIILIFNNEASDFKTIINRGVTLDFTFTYEEKLGIFNDLKEKANLDEEVLSYIKETCNASTQNLSIRTIQILSDLKNKKYDYKAFAKEILKKDEDLNMILSFTEKEWTTKTGLHRATYYRRKKKL